MTGKFAFPDVFAALIIRKLRQSSDILVMFEKSPTLGTGSLG